MFSSIVYANPTAVFELDEKGDCDIVLTDSIALGVDDVSFTASVDGTGLMNFVGSLVDQDTMFEPDYNLVLESDLDGTSIEFNTFDVADMIAETGEFDIDFSITEVEGSLVVDVEANVNRRLIEEYFLLDVDLIREDVEGFKTDFAGAYNEMFSLLGTASAPVMSIDELSIVGQDDLQIDLTMRIEGWSDFIAAILASTYQNDEGPTSFLSCLGIGSVDLISSVLGSSIGLTGRISTTNNMLTGSIESTSQGTSLIGGSNIQYLNAEMDKTGSTISLSGSLGATDSETLMTCLLQSYAPGDYTVDKLEYSIVDSGGNVIQTLEADLEDFAEKSNGNMKVDISSDLTSEYDVTVKIPSDMSIVSVDGGEKLNDRTVTANPGEELTVVYGAGGGLDWNLIVIIFFIVLVLFLTSKRKKK
jgi:hypothetical protein